MRSHFLLFCLLVAVTPEVRAHSFSGVRLSGADGDAVTRCEQMTASFEGDDARWHEEELPVASLRSLKLHDAGHGGVRVVGSSGSVFAIRVCKAAAIDADVSKISARVRGNEVVVEGPDRDEWVAVFLVQMPKGATLDVAALNGPLSLRDVSGTVTARATNGPISLLNSSGTVDAATVNGPISMSGGSGTMKLHVENGPLSIKLSGTKWSGGTLDASSENGPLSLRFPSGYGSKVVVDSSGHGPFICRATGCKARGGWDRDEESRHIVLGEGAAAVHVTAGNGPISIREID